MVEQIEKESHTHYRVVHHADLPVSCPNIESEQWSSHPKVYLSLELNERTACPYCGEVYLLVDD
ncbi:MAG: zinc-finger domain-containing protein [Piscirickettsiaceae bacterium]|nr:zinc-finger domain-containing protein [Piscirickettsiaceae bacterium]